MRKEHKSKTGGLTAAGRRYFKRTQGSNLKAPVTGKVKRGSKAAKRRKSFCARMRGMRKRQKPGNNTGKDRLSLSLKKWKC